MNHNSLTDFFLPCFFPLFLWWFFLEGSPCIGFAFAGTGVLDLDFIAEAAIAIIVNPPMPIPTGSSHFLCLFQNPSSFVPAPVAAFAAVFSSPSAISVLVCAAGETALVAPPPLSLGIGLSYEADGVVVLPGDPPPPSLVADGLVGVNVSADDTPASLACWVIA